LASQAAKPSVQNWKIYRIRVGFVQITEGINAFKELIKGMIALLLLKRAYLKAI
jgi:hypothetical protein